MADGTRVFRDSKLKACLADLILKKIAERLDDFLEVYIVRKTADIVVGLDDCGLAAETALDYVRIDCSLRKEIDSTDFLSFLLEDADEFLADYFTFLLRFGDAGELTVVALLGVDPDKIQVKLAVRTEYLLNLIALILTEKTVVNEHAGKLLADGS